MANDMKNEKQINSEAVKAIKDMQGSKRASKEEIKKLIDREVKKKREIFDRKSSLKRGSMTSRSMIYDKAATDNFALFFPFDSHTDKLATVLQMDVAEIHP